ncbi:MAG: DUF2203 domain-containing protein [Chloroflexi bacterium]|nr:DUF2203 domain-containing protein [Chloroflexota bacterium]MBI5080952.1 DUF2203 domain-containing protein [Chloroflexota bacterium]MBI5348845.1 DUF2203 domain-containing protein [Chloroflexota bacterium]
MPRHYYTVDEANALLPSLRRILSELMEARQRIVSAEPELWDLLEKSVRNGGGKKAGMFLKDFEIVQQNVRAIDALGIEIKDINSGLVDFWSKRDGREVYLCWRYGEACVEYWHDIDAGFGGRQPL